MMIFDYYNPVRLMFGLGAFERLGEAVEGGERHAMLVTGRGAARRLGYLDRALAMLRDRGLDVCVYDEIPPNPTDDVIDAGGELARREGCDLVVGLGGGSAMDAAKAIAVAAPHEFPIREFLIAKADAGKRVPTDATLPVICVTTTAGTSSELTPFSVITVQDCCAKTAIAGPQLFARAAICDPGLTYNVPPETTAATGVDVLCHAVEGYISTAAGPITDQAAEQAIRLAVRHLPRLADDPTDKEAREGMSLGNVFAGITLSNCGATLVHGLEHSVSGHYPDVAHGEGLAALLVAYAAACHEAWPEKFARVSGLLGGPAEAAAAADALEAFLERVGLNVKLRQLDVAEDKLERLADDALQFMGGAVDKTPGAPNRDLLMRILRESY